MSDTDSFIDEVTEEVRRDRIFGLMKRYGWIAILAVLLIVGGAAYREWSRAQDRAAAQAFGDAVLTAASKESAEARLADLQAVEAADPRAAAIRDMLIAAEQAELGDPQTAAATLRAIAANGDVAPIYRNIASFKAVTMDADMDPAQRRLELEALAAPGNPMRLLAEEQLALLVASEGNSEDAVARLERIVEDAEATAGLRRRALQLIVALGGPADAG